MKTIRLKGKDKDRHDKLMVADIANLVGLIEELGFNRENFFEYGDWDQIDFRGSNLAGVSFKGARLYHVSIYKDQLSQILSSSPECCESPQVFEREDAASTVDEVHVFTPKGDCFRLPPGSTSIDLAYAIHTGLAKHVIGTKINQKHMPLRTRLEPGDLVELIKGAEPVEPQLGWFGFVVTEKARKHLRRAVRRKHAQELRENEQFRFNRIRAALPPTSNHRSIQHVGTCLGIRPQENFLNPEALSNISDAKIAKAILKQNVAPDTSENPWALGVAGLGKDDRYYFSDCCSPLPQDRIMALRASDRVYAIHTIACTNVVSHISDEEELRDVRWASEAKVFKFMAKVLLVASDTLRLEMMGRAIALSGAGLAKTSIWDKKDDLLTWYELTLIVQDTRHLDIAIRTLKNCGAVSVKRL